MTVADYGMLISNNPNGFMESLPLKWPRRPRAMFVVRLPLPIPGGVVSMSVSMHWLGDRLGKCPDAAVLEYGCVDWFPYEASDRSDRRTRWRSKKPRAVSARGDARRRRLHDDLEVQHQVD